MPACATPPAAGSDDGEESGRGSHADKPHLAITVAQPTVGVIKWDRLEVS